MNAKDAVYAPASAEGPDAPLDFKPLPQPIIDVDLDSIEDKRWRKPGAHLSDYFNYGFDETSWLEWCAKQRRSRDELERMKDNPFRIFADRPLPEAWAALPMDLKGAMMQTIMSSFASGGPGGPGFGPNAGMGMGMGPGMGMGMGGMGMGMGGGAHPQMQAMMAAQAQGQPGMHGQQQQQHGGNFMMNQQGGGNTPNPGQMNAMMQQQGSRQVNGMGTGIGGGAFPANGGPGFQQHQQQQQQGK